MAFVDDHEVVLIDRRRQAVASGIEYALDQALDRADLHLGFGIGLHVAQSLQPEYFREGLGADHAGRAEFAEGLAAERAAIDRVRNSAAS